MPDFAAITLERLKAEPADEAVDKALASIAERNGELVDAEPRAAAKGDILVCDFTGRLPADLLKNGPGLGAVPGKPGQAPTGWELQLADGLSHEIAAIGSEKGQPYFDLAVTGTPAGKGVVRVLPATIGEAGCDLHHRGDGAAGGRRAARRRRTEARLQRIRRWAR